MPTKPKRATGRKVAPKAPATDASTTIVVRRGALKRYDSMKKKTAGMPVDLVWDRRVSGERRADEKAPEGERRDGDRRQSPPFTWTLADFVVVVPPDASGAPSKAPAAKKTKKR